MSEVINLFQEVAFDPETIANLSDAYARACKSLHDNGQPEIVKSVIAQRIIALAKQGERDPEKLSESALKALGPNVVRDRDP